MPSKAEVQARGLLIDLYRAKPCMPIMVRLAWHDAGTFSAKDNTGGANASIRFDAEISHGANAGLTWAAQQLQVRKKVAAGRVKEGEGQTLLLLGYLIPPSLPRRSRTPCPRSATLIFTSSPQSWLSSSPVVLLSPSAWAERTQRRRRYEWREGGGTDATHTPPKNLFMH